MQKTEKKIPSQDHPLITPHTATCRLQRATDQVGGTRPPRAGETELAKLIEPTAKRCKEILNSVILYVNWPKGLILARLDKLRTLPSTLSCVPFYPLGWQMGPRYRKVLILTLPCNLTNPALNLV